MTLIDWPVLPETAWVSPVWVLARMPDRSSWVGGGATAEEAAADARRHWLRQKRACPGRLAADGCGYQRRLRSRRRRR